jgi:hypothetical protein
MKKNSFTFKHLLMALSILAALGMIVPFSVYQYYKSSVPRVVKYHEKRLKWNRDELEKLVAMAGQVNPSNLPLEIENFEKSRKIEYRASATEVRDSMRPKETEFEQLMFAIDVARLRMNASPRAVCFLFDLFNNEPYDVMLAYFPFFDTTEAETRRLMETYRKGNTNESWLKPIDEHWAVLGRPNQNSSKK